MRKIAALLCIGILLLSSVPVAHAARPAPTSSPSLYATLALESEGDDVRCMQDALVELGYLDAEKALGIFDVDTEDAVMLFQETNGFPVDGIASDGMQILLFKGYAALAPDPQAEPVTRGKATDVWIPTNGGTKYHKTSTCSKMIDPENVSVEEAERLGFTPCKRCYGR